MKNGFRAFDSDMHVYDAGNLYEKHMNPKWGDRIPRGQRNGKHGRVEFSIAGGKQTLRGITEVIDHGQKQVADRYDFAVARENLEGIYEQKGMIEQALGELAKGNKEDQRMAPLLRQAFVKSGARGYWQKKLELQLDPRPPGHRDDPKP